MGKYIIKVISFTNSEVENKIDDVISIIEKKQLVELKVSLGGFRGGFLAELAGGQKESGRSIEI